MRYGIGSKKPITIFVFILDYFQEKQMTKFFKKFKKLCFGAILGSLCKNLCKMNFPSKKRLCLFLHIPIIYPCAKNQVKLMVHFWEKCQTDRWTSRWVDSQTDSWIDRRTDRQTGNCNFIRSSVGQGSKK